jgi:5'-nucleotidase
VTARILVSNDDGIAAKGLRALVDAVSPLAEVWVVAPETEQSASSHALSLHRPLRIRKHAERWFGVDGTPADCVYLAIHHLMKEGKPTLVLSGINHGGNLAEDVIYSGTVAAAMEGSLLGFPSIAFSLVGARKTHDFEHAARFAHALAKAALASKLPRQMLLNVNVPPEPPAGYEVTRLGRHTYEAGVIEKEDPRGRRYYWIGGTGYEHVSIPGTDCTAVHEAKKISITPLMLNLTDGDFLKPLEGWQLEGFTRG